MKKLSYLLFSLFIFSCNSKAQNETNKESIKINSENNKPKLTGKEIVTALDKLQFFNLTDKNELEETKAAFEKSYTEFQFFEGKMRGETLDFTDNRFYFVDTETLFEGGGLVQYLETVKVTFDKLKLKLLFSDEISNQTKTHWTHTIKLNGKAYTAYDHDFGAKDWGIVYINFIEMLNDQLKLQKSEEQFYPISGENDGRMVLLTQKQFEFVIANYPNDENLPKELDEWKKGYGL